jgi:transcriptional regulator
LPALVLRVLHAGPKHGYAIAQEIKRVSNGVLDFREGTLYPALHAQEQNGWIESYQETVAGRRRRYYRLTRQGHRALATERREWKQLSEAIDAILEAT